MKLVLGDKYSPSSIASSPLSMSSFILTGKGKLSKRTIPAVTIEAVNEVIGNVRNLPVGTDTSHQAIRIARETISAAFSSISVLNASFIDPIGLGHGSLCVDLCKIREAYNLIMSVEKYHPSIIATLGRATLRLSDQLRECPFDDGENLSVFFIVLENPLILRSAEFHVAIEQVIGGILSLPKMYRLLLFKWMKSYPSEYFGRVLQILQNYLSYALNNKTANLDPTPAVLVLET